MEKIKQDIAAIQAIADGWKKLQATGQLQIAIGALGEAANALKTAVEFANHHINLPAPAPAVDKSKIENPKS